VLVHSGPGGGAREMGLVTCGLNVGGLPIGDGGTG